MSYASECLARGRNMWDELGGNWGARRILVVVLAAPVVLLGILIALLVASLIAIFSAVPWDVLLDESGFVSAFIMSYSFVGICSITAPKFKFTIAAVIAVACVALSYPYPWRPPDTDVDATSPYGSWAGIVTGCSTVVFMVRLHLRPRWLLLLPAYFAGFVTSLVLTMTLAFPLVGILTPRAYWFACLLPIASLGATFSCRLMAPCYRNPVTTAAVVASLLLYIAIYIVVIGSSAE